MAHMAPNPDDDAADDAQPEADNLHVGHAFDLRAGRTLVIVGVTDDDEHGRLYEAEVRHAEGETETLTYRPHNIDAALAGGAEYVGTREVPDVREPFFCPGCEKPQRHEDGRTVLLVSRRVCSYGCGQDFKRARRTVGNTEPRR